MIIGIIAGSILVIVCIGMCIYCKFKGKENQVVHSPHKELPDEDGVRGGGSERTSHNGP